MTSSTATPMTSLDLIDRPQLNTSFRRPAMLALTCDMHELLDAPATKTLERVKGIEPSYSAGKSGYIGEIGKRYQGQSDFMCQWCALH
jgi:hypothetical protein